MNTNTPSSNVQQMIWSLLAPIPDRNTSPIVGQTMDLLMPQTHRGFMGDCQNHFASSLFQIGARMELQSFLKIANFFLQQDRLRTKGQTKASFLTGMLNLKGHIDEERTARKGNNQDKKFFRILRVIRLMTKCLLSLKVALSQNRPEDFYISKINIPNHYPEKKI
jgi:hypothetical protein